MPFGFWRRILRVDLTEGRTCVDEPSEDFYRKYMGGSALNMYYILKGVPAGVDAFDPRNILAVSASVLTGAPFPGQSRATVSAKSPLTGGIGDSQCGGFWPAMLKASGVDGIIISGRARRPVYLWINDGEVEIRDATALWGRITGEAEDLLKAEVGDDRAAVMQIGPAGERLVRFGSIISMCSRAHGRTGMGAVMGSKNLKAIAVLGNRKIPIADREVVRQLARKGKEDFPHSQIANMGKYGTVGILPSHQETGALPSFNYRQGVFDSWDRIDGHAMYDTILRGRQTNSQDRLGRDTCFGCVVRCKRIVEIDDGPYRVDPRYGGPEYETICTFGSYCGVGDLAAIAKANEICNQYGMDTISCGATIAWTMAASEAAVLPAGALGEVSPAFGDAQSMVRLTEMIGRREGIGRLLGEGSARAAAVLGVGQDLLITCKNSEIPAHMPQIKRGLGLVYGVNPIGADHMSCEHDFPYEDGFELYRDRLLSLGLADPQKAKSLTAEKVRYAVTTQYLFSTLDSLNLCAFVFGPSYQLYGPEDILTALRGVTGWRMNMDELMTLGRRRLSMLRAFNAREGFTKADDALPDHFFTRPLRGGPSDGLVLDRQEYEAASASYYALCGWDADTGNPSIRTLQGLGIEIQSAEGEENV